MVKIYISLGSNIDRERNTREGIRALRDRFGELELSSVYESEAVGFEGDAFYNMVIACEVSEDVHSANRALAEIEDAHGRDRSAGKFSSRSLDLDLLLYDDLILEEEGLHLPRKEILEYAFVLKPLAEIAGEMKHPVTGFSFSATWDQFDPTAQPMWPIKD